MIKILLALQHFGEHKLPDQDSFRVEWDGHTAEEYYNLLGEGYEETQSQEWYAKLFKTFSEKMKGKGFEIDHSEEDLFECITYVTRTFDTEGAATYWLHGFFDRAQSIVVGAEGDDDYSDYAPDYVNALIQASKQIDNGELAKTFLQWMKEEESEFFDDNGFNHALKLLDPPDKEAFIKDIEDFIMEHPYMEGRNHESWDPQDISEGKVMVVDLIVHADDGSNITISITTTQDQLKGPK